MKKVLIVNNNLAIGGVQSSLIHLLACIKDRCDVTLLLFHIDEQDRARIPEGVRLVTVRSPMRHLGMSRRHTKGKPLTFLARAFWVVLTRLFGHHTAFSLMLTMQKHLSGYDCAISYLHESPLNQLYGGCNRFVLDRVDAPVKIAWLHGDLSRCGADAAWCRRLYGRFDRIVACSEGTRKAFLSRLPEYANKTLTIRNCNDYAAIRARAGEGERYARGAFHVVTVARLSEEKGIERALRAVSYVKAHGRAVHYHIVGDGKQREALERLSEQLGLTGEVTFYGDRRNPYPYIKSADLLLLTSYHEAAPMVLDEAACLGVPVLSTKTTSTDEMVLGCGSGFVAEQEQQSINERLLYLLENEQLLQDVRATLAERVLCNDGSVARFEALINE